MESDNQYFVNVYLYYENPIKGGQLWKIYILARMKYICEVSKAMGYNTLIPLIEVMKRCTKGSLRLRSCFY